MLKNWFRRIARIASSTFGANKEDGFSLETSLTKFERFVHFWVLVCRSFVRNRCPVRASALSYTTLLALIPIVAVAMGVTSAILESKGEAQIRVFIEEFVERIVPASTVTKQHQLIGPLPSHAMTANLDAIQFGVDEARAKAGNEPIFAATNEPIAISTNIDFAVSGTSQAATNSAAAAVETPSASGIAEAKQKVSTQAANFIYDFAKRSSPKTLGFTGMFFLIVTAIMMLTRVEETFNDIWGVTRGRDWTSRVPNYLCTIAFGPVLIIFAIGLMNSPSFERSQDYIRHIPFLEPVLTRFLPLAIICFTFALFYKLVPNTKVDFSAALVGGSLAGLSWHCYNKIAVWIASRAVSGGGTSAVYGGLAMVPLLMAGLYVVWLTVLFGAQVAYAYQNRASYLQDRLVENVNQRGREFVALRLMTCIGQRFFLGQSPATIREISAELGIPSKLVQQVMRTLLAAGLVVEVNGGELGYSPARPLETINCHQILLAMRATHGQEPATRDEPVRIEVLGEFARIQAAEREAASTVTMFALVNRAQARLGGITPTAEIPPHATNVTPPVAAVNLFEREELSAEEEDQATPAVKFEIATPATPPAPVAAKLDPLQASKKSISPAPPTVAISNHDNESFPL